MARKGGRTWTDKMSERSIEDINAMHLAICVRGAEESATYLAKDRAKKRAG
jgi:hypothetical protein